MRALKQAGLVLIFTVGVSLAAVRDAEPRISEIRKLLVAERYSEVRPLLASLSRDVQVELGHDLPEDLSLKLTASVHNQAPRPIPPLDRILQLIKSAKWDGALFELRRVRLILTQLSLGASRREMYLKLAEEGERDQNPGKLQMAARTALGVGDLGPATQYVDKSIVLLEGLRGMMSTSTLLHRGHTIKGLIYAADENAISAAKELMLSVENVDLSGWSMPPSMQLADRLLELNDSDSVGRYLDACVRAGWKEPRLTEWKAAIRTGKSPSFPGTTYLF